MKILLGIFLSLITISVNAMQTIEVEKPIFISFASENNTFLEKTEINKSESTDNNIYISQDSNGQVLLTRVNPNSNFDKFTKKISAVYYEGKSSAEYQDMLEDERKKEQEKRLDLERQLAKKPNARIGMTRNQILNQSNWGQPDDINTTIDAYGTFEQWVYGSDQYLYFKNGKLTTIQQ